jgi:hypothetical protein
MEACEKRLPAGLDELLFMKLFMKPGVGCQIVRAMASSLLFPRRGFLSSALQPAPLGWVIRPAMRRSRNARFSETERRVDDPAYESAVPAREMWRIKRF